MNTMTDAQARRILCRQPDDHRSDVLLAARELQGEVRTIDMGVPPWTRQVWAGIVPQADGTGLALLVRLDVHLRYDNSVVQVDHALVPDPPRVCSREQYEAGLALLERGMPNCWRHIWFIPDIMNDTRDPRACRNGWSTSGQLVLPACEEDYADCWDESITLLDLVGCMGRAEIQAPPEWDKPQLFIQAAWALKWSR
jgi:hypothetical protein